MNDQIVLIIGHICKSDYPQIWQSILHDLVAIAREAKSSPISVLYAVKALVAVSKSLSGTSANASFFKSAQSCMNSLVPIWIRSTESVRQLLEACQNPSVNFDELSARHIPFLRISKECNKLMQALLSRQLIPVELQPKDFTHTWIAKSLDFFSALSAVFHKAPLSSPQCSKIVALKLKS